MNLFAMGTPFLINLVLFLYQIESKIQEQNLCCTHKSKTKIHIHFSDVNLSLNFYVWLLLLICCWNDTLIMNIKNDLNLNYQQCSSVVVFFLYSFNILSLYRKQWTKYSNRKLNKIKLMASDRTKKCALNFPSNTQKYITHTHKHTHTHVIWCKNNKQQQKVTDFLMHEFLFCPFACRDSGL